MPLGGRPLEGEHDCRLGLPLGPGSTEEDRGLGTPGLPLEADNGLSGTDVLKFGGTSSENPGISEGFQGLDFTVGELPRDCTGFLDAVGPDLVAGGPNLVTVGPDLVAVGPDLYAAGPSLDTEDDLTGGADTLDTLDGVDGRRVGVAALGVGLDAGTDSLAVGVEDLAVDLDNGVEDLAETVGLVGGKVGREVGVDGLEGLDVAVNVERPVGVAGLDPAPPDDEGLRSPALETEFNPGDEEGCLETKLLLVTVSAWGFANLDFSAVGRALGVPI